MYGDHTVLDIFLNVLPTELSPLRLRTPGHLPGAGDLRVLYPGVRIQPPSTLYIGLP